MWQTIGKIGRIFVAQSVCFLKLCALSRLPRKKYSTPDKSSAMKIALTPTENKRFTTRYDAKSHFHAWCRANGA